GFADVGPSDDGGANAPAQYPSFIGCAQQFVGESDAGLQAADQFFAGVRSDVFVREINMGFDVGQSFHQIVPQKIDALGKFAGQLFVGGGEGQFGAGMDQIGHGFGLGQINAAIEKGAPGKFARSGQTRAV